MPVNVAAGVDVVFDDREPPGVEDAAAGVVGVVAAATGVVVLLPADAATVVVVEPAPAAAVVVVVLPLDFFFGVLVLVDAEASACLPPDFFAADGLDEPQAAAIRPAATTTPMIRSHFATWWGARPGFDLVESMVVCMVVCMVVPPLSSSRATRLVRRPFCPPLAKHPLFPRLSIISRFCQIP
jgi:hypothetical protein